ncbi:MAG TPA: ArsR family transcriptional regulator [Geobacteraceae bacterium]
MDVPRISAAMARERVRSGKTLLVCAYESNELYDHNHLDGAISLDEFTSRLPTLGKKTEIIFYCA